MKKYTKTDLANDIASRLVVIVFICVLLAAFVYGVSSLSEIAKQKQQQQDQQKAELYAQEVVKAMKKYELENR